MARGRPGAALGWVTPGPLRQLTGGYLYDATGSYDIVWYIAIGLGVLAGLVNLPIKEAPIQRAQPQAA